MTMADNLLPFAW